MQIIDIVDENDNVIGQMDRAEAHRQHKNIRIAAVFVQKTNGNIVLHRISRQKPTNPLKWSYSAAGHIDAGEEYAVAAQRELHEELGIDVPIEQFTHMVKTAYLFSEGNVTGSFHGVFHIVHDGPFVFDPEEIEEIREFTVDELRRFSENQSTDFNRRTLADLKTIGLI